MRSITIGARGSSLSLCQTEIVRARLEERYPDYRFKIHTIHSKADQKPDTSLMALGGEGIFVKELEAALSQKRIDVAVHSMKDLPLEIPAGLCLAAVTEREDPRDALVSRAGQGWQELPAEARIGTSSPRRISQLLARRQDVELLEIRGNVDTRLRKLDEGRYDAIVLAACGLIRLGLEDRITEYLSFDVMLPEPGQGALGIEARSDDRQILDVLGYLDDAESRACIEAERAFLGALGGGCRVPIAAYAHSSTDGLELTGAVTALDGSKQLRRTAMDAQRSATALGERLAQRLLDAGAGSLLSPRPAVQSN